LEKKAHQEIKMKMFAQKTMVAGMVVFLATTVGMYGATLYSDSTVDTGVSLNFTNGMTMGNQIHLASGANVTSFSYEIYSPDATFTGSVQMEAFLYANDGAAFNGYLSPSTSLYDSGLFSLLTPVQSVGGDVETLNFTLSTSVPVGSDFTLAIEVTGLAGGDTVGMELFNPATVGENYGDYWLDNGGSWQLLTNSVPPDFGAQVIGTATPEPSTVCLGVVGAALLTGFTWLRRRQNQSKQS
jgi:hypothetical protein